MDAPTVDDAIRKVDVTFGLVKQVVAFLNEFRNKCGSQPWPGSPADLEPRTFPDADLVKTAYVQGDLLMQLAIDQISAFVRTVTEPILTFAPWTCARAVLESSAFAAWLLDPNIDVKTRIARCLAFRYEGLSQQVTFWRTAGDEEKANAITLRLSDTERLALDLGFQAQETKNRKRNGIAMVMPSSTEIVRRMVDQEANYRLLSAVIHGHGWALTRLGMHEVDHDSAIWENHLEARSVITMCIMTTTAFTKPVWYMCQLHGWDTASLASIFDIVYDNLGIMNAKYRIWK